MFDGVGLQKTRKTHLVGGFKDFFIFQMGRYTMIYHQPDMIWCWNHHPSVIAEASPGAEWAVGATGELGIGQRAQKMPQL